MVIIQDRTETTNSVSREIQDLQVKEEILRAEILTEEREISRIITAETLTAAEDRAERDLRVRTEISVTTEMTAGTDRTEANADLPADRGMHHMAETALRQQTRSSRDATQEQIAIIKKEIVTAERMARQIIQSVKTAAVTGKADALI